MTPQQAARATWEKDPRKLTESVAAGLAQLLPDGTEDEGAEAA